MIFNIALIDDDREDRVLFARWVDPFDVCLQTYRSSVDFFKKCDPDKFHFVFIDYTINHGDGAEKILEKLLPTRAKVVFISHGEKHLEESKKFEDHPRIHGLLLKSEPEKIQEWLAGRIWEVQNPDEVKRTYERRATG